MKFSRRDLFSGASAAATFAALPKDAKAWLPGASGSVIGSGWNTLPRGWGGLSTGFSIANDGTAVIRTDVGGTYIFSGKVPTDFFNPSAKWLPLFTYASLPMAFAGKTSNPGSYEVVIAPTDSNYIYSLCRNWNGSNYALCFSRDRGANWNVTSVLTKNADPNTYATKTSQQKIAVDPNQSKIVYCGLPNANGQTYGAYVATDGETFRAITALGNCSVDPGVCGIAFDKNFGTIVVGSQTRSARLLLPVGGNDIFETFDGGQTFQATNFPIAAGRSNFATYQAWMDYNGVYYALLRYSTGASALWRYIRGLSSGTGKWTNIGTGISSFLGCYPGSGIIVDPRSTNTGYLSFYGPNGLGIGFTATNADTGNPPTWRGSTGGEVPGQHAPQFDVGWLNKNPMGRNAYVTASMCAVDQDGYCWWCGNGGALYYFTLSDYLTSAGPPHYSGGGYNTYSVTCSRGGEGVVAQDTICPPGATFPVTGAQDVGIQQGTFTTYPTDYYPSPSRIDCPALEYTAADPKTVVAIVTAEDTRPPQNNSCFSGYSKNYGNQGSWTAYNPQPQLMYIASAIGTIAGGVLTVTRFNTSPTGLGNLIFPNLNNPESGGMYIFEGRSGSSLGRITSQLSGTSGGTGTYAITSKTLSRPASQTFYLNQIPTSGYMVAVDANHVVMVPDHNGGANRPIYSANATSNPCTWNWCNGLPFVDWSLRGFQYGPTFRCFAVGYGADLGTVWACYTLKGTAYLFLSTDSGANFTQIASWAISVSCTAVYLLSVPGFPNELWMSGQFTGSSPVNPSKLWHITNANSLSPTVTQVPPAQGLVYDITMGAPATPGGYPSIFGLFYSTYGAQCYLYEGQWSGTRMNWTILGPTGTSADLPPVQQVSGFQSIRGDFNVYRRLYVAAQQTGFAYYNP